MNTTTEQATAIDIIARHYDTAWRMALSADWMKTSGRFTKAKQEEARVKQAVADELRSIVEELRAAGYEIPE